MKIQIEETNGSRFHQSNLLVEGVVDFAFAMIKPDGIEQILDNVILQRIEDAGFVIVKRKLMQLTEPQVDGIYPNMTAPQFRDEMMHFYPFMRQRMANRLVMPLIIGGSSNVCEELHRLKGGTTQPGTIRGDYSYKRYVTGEEYDLWAKNLHPIERQAELTEEIVMKNRIHSLEHRDTSTQAFFTVFTNPELIEASERFPALRRSY